MRRRENSIKVKFAAYALIVLAGFFGWLSWAVHAAGTPSVEFTEEVDVADMRIDKYVEISGGTTYGELMDSVGVPDAESTAVYNAAYGAYDLAAIKAGRTIRLSYDRAGTELLEVMYQTNSENELFVIKGGDGNWNAELVPIQYEVRVKTAEGVIEDSLYVAALEQGIREGVVIGFAEVFQWSVDFAMDLRRGDTYKFIYEERYRDGEYVMPGAVLAGRFVNDGKAYYAFYHESADGEWGHYDENGNSVQKIFLKAPVAFKYISSGFTTGRRYIQAFNISTGHRAIDYAAAYGTPVRSVGDGTVVYAGWKGAYGNFVSVRHNGTYTTNYAHLSRYAVGYGQKVSQGQTIGYVGSTGLSTGPHLHYEMVKYGVKVNPLKEVLPPGDPIGDEERAVFTAAVDRYSSRLVPTKL